MDDYELNEEYIPEYSDVAELNLAIMYGAYEEMLIYIEDVNGVGIYETIFEKLNVSNFNIQPTGGKPQLIRIFNDYINDPTSFPLPCLFIADRDFEEILDKEKMIKDNHFLYLERYSIENYLLTEEAGISFLRGRIQERRQKCSEKLNFRSWEQSFEEEYEKLLYLLISIQKIELGVKNCNHKIDRFFDPQKQKLDRAKLLSYFREVYQKYKVSPQKDIYNLKRIYKKIRRDVDIIDVSLSWIIPGKHILQALCHHLENISNDTVKYSDFITFISSYTDVSNLQFIKNRVIELRNVS